MLSYALRSKKISLCVRQFCCRHASSNVPHVAIVGGGPAAFYSAQYILKKLGSNVLVDIFEKNPIPFGLVRYGVAPDHPEVKNVINTFTKVADNPRCAFFGNVEIGKDILIKDLRTCYTAVVMAYGCSEDNRLNIPGENMKNILPASSVINWYNGYPGYRDIAINLAVESCVVLGQGNVAVDVARMLLTPPSLLKKTDISDRALEKLSESKVRRVFVVGRRGPTQAAFTPAEFRETIKIPGCRPVLKKDDYADVDVGDVQRPWKRLVELQMKTALEGQDGTKWQDANRELHYIFKRSPLQFLPYMEDPVAVGAVEFGINEMQGPGRDDRAVPTGRKEIVEAQLVVTSIGYHGKKLEEDQPFDDKRRVLPNLSGRVIGCPGMYCSGWIKTGPVGVIASTMNNAFETAQCVVDDILAGVFRDDRKTPELRDGLLEKFKTKYVTFDDWKKLDDIEIERGRSAGKSRQKVDDVDEMLKLMREE